MSMLAVDAGTSAIKAVAFDDGGAELAVVRRGVDVLRPGGARAEQDMDAVWEAIADAVAEAAATLDEPPDLLTITAQGDGCWLVDADGRPTGNAVLWNDGRGAELVQRWESDGTLEQAFRRNGSIPFPGLSVAILPWLREHEPGRVERAAAALYCNGWAFLKLTGEFAVDETDASIPLLDIAERRYDDELVDLYGLGWARHLLPDVRAMDGRSAPLTAAAAQRTGLTEGLPVVMGPFDVAATALGCGAVAPGDAATILGTTLCTVTVVDSPAPATAGEPAGFTIATGAPGRWLRAFPTTAGTDVLDWAAKLLGAGDAAALVELAASAEEGSGGVVFCPYLSPAGERAPFLDVAARGTWLGVTLEHGRAEMARSVLEGLSLVVRDCLEAAGERPAELKVCGGGAASDTWLALLADVLGVPVVRTEGEELGARGALATALVATGREPSVEAAASRLTRRGAVFAPDAGAAARWDGRFARFIRVRDAVREVWPQVADATTPSDD